MDGEEGAGACCRQFVFILSYHIIVITIVVSAITKWIWAHLLGVSEIFFMFDFCSMLVRVNTLTHSTMTLKPRRRFDKLKGTTIPFQKSIPNTVQGMVQDFSTHAIIPKKKTRAIYIFEANFAIAFRLYSNNKEKNGRCFGQNGLTSSN